MNHNAKTLGTSDELCKPSNLLSCPISEILDLGLAGQEYIARQLTRSPGPPSRTFFANPSLSYEIFDDGSVIQHDGRGDEVWSNAVDMLLSYFPDRSLCGRSWSKLDERHVTLLAHILDGTREDVHKFFLDQGGVE